MATVPVDKNSPILITGARGFIGRNLTARLTALGYTALRLYDMDSTEAELRTWAAEAAFVFHIAGVNRPKDTAEFYSGNAGLTGQLLALLQQAQNPAPVLLTSSTQVGNGSDYGKSKAEAEAAVFEYEKQTAARVYVFQLPGVFGKWSRPGYNSVVATFCHNIANGLPIEVRDPAFALPLCYIDDVVDAFLMAMDTQQPPPRPGTVMGILPTYNTTLGWLAETIQSFKQNRETLALPDMADELTQKLYATYLSYLPTDGFAYPLKANRDERGSFTEFLRTQHSGQVSVNVAKPGITKGNHWHDTKNEKFWVVSGEGIIRFRKIGENEIIEYRVNGDEPVVLDIPTGYTHNIENVGKTDLVTVMWASEAFDPESPDTYFEKV